MSLCSEEHGTAPLHFDSGDKIGLHDHGYKVLIRTLWKIHSDNPKPLNFAQSLLEVRT
jgi:hypothetical protein